MPLPVPCGGVFDGPEISAAPIRLVLKIAAAMAYRVYDEFDPAAITKNQDGSFMVMSDLPGDGWVEGYILSYGDTVEVIEPQWLQEAIKQKLGEQFKKVPLI